MKKCILSFLILFTASNIHAQIINETLKKSMNPKKDFPISEQIVKSAKQHLFDKRPIYDFITYLDVDSPYNPNNKNDNIKWKFSFDVRFQYFVYFPSDSLEDVYTAAEFAYIEPGKGINVEPKKMRAKYIVIDGKGYFIRWERQDSAPQHPKLNDHDHLVKKIEFLTAPLAEGGIVASLEAPPQ